jgi:hypothetical protein
MGGGEKVMSSRTVPSNRRRVELEGYDQSINVGEPDYSKSFKQHSQAGVVH